MRAQYINEKFIEESDPIHDLGIGIYAKRRFKDEDDAADWFFKYLTVILGTDKIPDDIIFPEDENTAFNWKYYNILDEYAKNYTKMENRHTGNPFAYIYMGVRNKLLKLGYPKRHPDTGKRIKPQKHIDEKFIESDDAIYDMGIGLKSRYKDLVKLFGNADKNHYIFTVYVRNGYIDFWFNNPKIKNLPKNEIDKLGKYVKDIINNLGFSSILIKPRLIRHYFKKDDVTLPRIVRFTITPTFKDIVPRANYRRQLSKPPYFTDYHEYEYEHEKKYRREIRAMEGDDQK